MEATLITPQLLSAEQSAIFLGISERLFHELRHTPDFPKAVMLGARCVRWKRTDLSNYIDNLATVGPQPEPTQLRRIRAAG